MDFIIANEKIESDKSSIDFDLFDFGKKLNAENFDETSINCPLISECA